MTKHLFAIGLITLLSAAHAFAAGDEDVFELQPEIHHAFRPAESMPPAWFSQLFSLIALSPWIVLMVGVSHSSKCVRVCIYHSFFALCLVARFGCHSCQGPRPTDIRIQQHASRIHHCISSLPRLCRIPLLSLLDTSQHFRNP